MPADMHDFGGAFLNLKLRQLIFYKFCFNRVHSFFLINFKYTFK